MGILAAGEISAGAVFDGTPSSLLTPSMQHHMESCAMCRGDDDLTVNALLDCIRQTNAARAFMPNASGARGPKVQTNVTSSPT